MRLFGRAGLTCSGFNGLSLAFYRWRGYQQTQHTRETHGCGIEVEEVRMERLLLDGRRENRRLPLAPALRLLARPHAPQPKAIEL